MILDVGHLQIVDAIARAGTVTRAAEELHVTQPAVSHRLRELEERLGTKLFRRSGRRMSPTEEGALLLVSARRVLSELERVEDEIGQHRNGQRGTLRVATECYTCYHWLPATIRQLESALPNVSIRIVPELTRNPLPALLDRTLDLALLYDVPDDPRIATFQLFRDELVGVVHHKSPLARKSFLDARDFGREALICHFADPGRAGVLEREVLEPAGVKPRRVLEMQLTAAVLEMVRADMGIAVLPRWVLPQGRGASKLAVVRVTRKGLFRNWHAAVLRDQAAKPAVTTLVRLLAEQVPNGRR